MGEQGSATWLCGGTGGGKFRLLVSGLSRLVFVAGVADDDDSLLVLASILNWEAHPNNKHLEGIV